MACRGITFVAPDGAAYLLNTDCSCNIAEASQLISPLLSGHAPLFKETLNWIQFTYTADSTGDYVAPDSTVLVPSAVLDGDPIFPDIWRHLLRRFPGAYDPTPSTLGPQGPDY